MISYKYLVATAMVLLALSGTSRASEVGNVAQHFHNAYAAAGTEHFNLYNMLCPRLENASAGKIATPPDARINSIQYAVPKRVFKDLYYVGEYYFWESSVAAWAVDTGDGIVLIDSLYPDSVHLIESGFRTLGLNITDVKYLFISHGHEDHYGGAKYLQDTYGMRVMMSEAEWDFMYNNSKPADTKPKKDMIVEDGQDFELGNTTFHFYITPGHTPGTVSTIFNVHGLGDDEDHIVAQWGGTGFGFNGATGDVQREWFNTYATQAERFQHIVQEYKADVLLANHPGLDNTYLKFAAADQGLGNPWVIGTERVVNYIKTAESCANAGIAAHA